MMRQPLMREPSQTPDRLRFSAAPKSSDFPMSRSAWVGVDPSEESGLCRLSEETRRSDFGAVKAVVDPTAKSTDVCDVGFRRVTVRHLDRPGSMFEPCRDRD